MPGRPVCGIRANVEVSCSRCQRRYAVADYKVVGRRRTSRCRCGNLLVFDGRMLSAPGMEGVTADAQPLEPTLTPSTTQAQASDPEPSSAAASEPPPAPPPGESQDIAAEAPADPQSIGRIRLRKAELRPAEATAEEQQPRAPSAQVDGTPSLPPDSPGSLHEAFDSLHLDRLAESIHPTWEAPLSQRVTPPGENPEVIVHYPSAWQPPPSARRRMRAGWDVTPTLPLSLAPQPSDTLDDDWESSAGEPAPSAPASPTPFELATTVKSAEPPQVEPSPPPVSERDSASDLGAPADASTSAPEATPRVGRSGGPGLESTAPTTLSQHPPARRHPSRAKLWGAGLAAAAVMALVWRSTSTQPTDPSGPSAAAPRPAQVDAAPVSGPRAPAPPLVVAGAVATATATATSAPASDASDAPAAVPPAPATPEPAPASPLTSTTPPTPATQPAPTRRVATPTQVTTPAPAPVAARPVAPIQPSSPELPEPTPRDPEATGPNPGEVARALSAAAARARSCTGPAGFPADGSIRILLDPAGGVLNATALGVFQGTAAGACVENAFRTAQTPAYGGRSLSTVYSFSISVD